MRTTRTAMILALIGAAALPVAAAAAEWACSPWETVSPSPFPLDLATVVHAQGLYWGFGASGVAVSADGLSWQRRSRTSGQLAAALWTGSEFLGVAGNQVLASPDGLTWSVRHEVWQDPIFFTIDLRSIATNGERDVAVGEDYSGRYYMWSPVVLFSPDGVTWSRASLPPLSDYSHSSVSAVIWAKGRFLASGSYLLSSPDGETWTVDESVHGNSLASNGDLVVIASDEALSLSTDLATWESVATPVTGGRIAYESGRFWLAGRCSTCPDREPSLWSSSDARSWQRVSLDVPVPLRAFTSDGTRIVAIGNGAAASTDGATWHTANAQVATSLADLAWGGSRFVAVGDLGELVTSEDGRTWHRLLWGGSTPLMAVTWGKAGFVAVGEGIVLTSADGVAWTPHAAPSSTTLTKVVGNATGYVAVTWDRELFFSPDGASWTAVSIVPLVNYAFATDLLAGPDRFVLSVWMRESGGAVLASSDGLTWQLGTLTHSGLPDLAYGGGRYLATDFAEVLASSDGLSWQQVSSGVELTGLQWLGERFVGWRLGGSEFYSSADGSTWSRTQGPGTGATSAVGPVLWRVGGSIARTACGVPATVADLPSLAHLPGAQGTLWRSDLSLHNPGADPITVGLVATIRGQVGTAGETALALRPGEARRFDDVVATELGIDDAATVRLMTWGGPGLVAARTYNDTPAGTFGQSIPALAPAAALAAGGESRLLQLSHAADRGKGFRTNIGVVNVSSSPAVATVDLYRADHAPLGTLTQELRGGESAQLNDVFRAVGTGDVADGYAIVHTASPDAMLHTYASVVDNLSGDPFLMAAAPLIAAGQSAWLPGAGHVVGFNGSIWRTDLELHNPGASEAHGLVELFPWGAEVTAPPGVTVAVPAGASVRLADVVWAQFARNGGASLRVTPTDGALMATARTFTTGATGTLGQGMPALLESESITADRSGRLIMLRQSPWRSTGYRSNLGLVNASAVPTGIEVELRDAAGALLGTVSQTLRAFESVQLNEVLRQVAPGGIDEAVAVVRVSSGGAKVLAYSCLIDNRTNDPILLPAMAE